MLTGGPLRSMPLSLLLYPWVKKSKLRNKFFKKIPTNWSKIWNPRGTFSNITKWNSCTIYDIISRKLSHHDFTAHAWGQKRALSHTNMKSQKRYILLTCVSQIWAYPSHVAHPCLLLVDLSSERNNWVVRHFVVYLGRASVVVQ